MFRFDFEMFPVRDVTSKTRSASVGPLHAVMWCCTRPRYRRGSQNSLGGIEPSSSVLGGLGR